MRPLVRKSCVCGAGAFHANVNVKCSNIICYLRGRVLAGAKKFCEDMEVASISKKRYISTATWCECVCENYTSAKLKLYHCQYENYRCYHQPAAMHRWWPSWQPLPLQSHSDSRTRASISHLPREYATMSCAIKIAEKFRNIGCQVRLDVHIKDKKYKERSNCGQHLVLR